MLAVKEKIVSALDSMTDNEMQNLWRFMQRGFSASQAWDNIKYDIPTKEERDILNSIDEKDVNFISQKELLAKMGIAVSNVV